MRDVALDTLAPAALTTLADVKVALGISGAGDDALLTAYINAASHLLERYCDAVFTTRTITEAVWDDDAVARFVTRYRPIITLTSLTVDGVAATLSDYYAAKADGIVRRNDGAVFASPGLKFVAVYTAGFGAAAANMPTPIQEAARLLTRDLYMSRRREAGLASESVPDVASRDYGDPSAQTVAGANGVRLPASVASLVAPYRQTWWQ